MVCAISAIVGRRSLITGKSETAELAVKAITVIQVRGSLRTAKTNERRRLRYSDRLFQGRHLPSGVRGRVRSMPLSNSWHS